MVKRLIWIYHLLITLRFGLSRCLTHATVASAGVRTLLFHEVEKDNESRFASQIDSCSRFWTFADPALFEKAIKLPRESDRRIVFLTFDDGYASCFDIAQKVLNPRGIKALFFVIPKFIDLADTKDYERFVTEKLFPDQQRSHIPIHLRSMNWDQVRELSKQGHTVGSHSLSHTRLNDLCDNEVMEREILDSRRVIEREIGQKVEHFAFPFGDLMSISPTALSLAAKHYKFVHSGLRGNNLALRKGLVLRRDTVFPWDPAGFEIAALEGAADSRYQKALSILDSWVSPTYDW